MSVHRHQSLKLIPTSSAVRVPPTAAMSYINHRSCALESLTHIDALTTTLVVVTRQASLMASPSAEISGNCSLPQARNHLRTQSSIGIDDRLPVADRTTPGCMHNAFGCSELTGSARASHSPFSLRSTSFLISASYAYLAAQHIAAES